METEEKKDTIEEQETAQEATAGETTTTASGATQETKAINNGLDVFISYSTKNKNVADAVVANFEQHGIRCWYAPRDILPGQEWVSAIKEALHKAKVFVLIYTDESNASRQVMNEVALAFNANKTIVPFRLTEGNMNDELEYYLTRVHWLDAVSKPLERNIDALRNYVDANLNRPKSADPVAAAPAAPMASTPKKEEKKKSKVGLWIGLAVAALAVIVGGVFAAMKLSGPKKEDLMKAGFEALYYGLTGTEDLAKARENYEAASKKGVADAYYYLGQICEAEYDYQGAREAYEQGIDAGSDLARLGMGYLWQRGLRGEADMKKAWDLYNEALDHGCVEADYFRAKIISGGFAGQEADAETAVKLLKNVTQDSTNPLFVAWSYNELGKIYRKGRLDVPVDYNASIESYSKVAETIDSKQFRQMRDYNSGLTYHDMGEEIKAEDHFRTALELFKDMADADSINAMYWVGNCYRYGNGTEKNYEEAIKWYVAANDAAKERNSKTRCHEAVYALGQMYEYGYGCNQDYEKAYEYYKEASDYGYGLAANAVGNLYNFGHRGTDADGNPDYKMARQWYDKAIEHGCTDAYQSIGYIYSKGLDVEVDKDKALEYFRKGAELGSSICMFNVGAMYHQRNEYEEALKWYQKAADMEYVNAYYRLGTVYEIGEVTGLDMQKAAEWYQKSANAGDEDGMLKYGELMLGGADGLEKNEEEGIKWLTKLAEQGNQTARIDLGNYYFNLEDYANAFIYYKALADAGFQNAALYRRLGQMYLDGNGVNQNEKEGLAWLTKAAENDDQKAMVYLGNYAFNHEDYTNAFIYYKKLADIGMEDKVLYHGMGKMYREGLGTTKDAKNAFTWLVKAFEAGVKLSIEEAKFVGYKYYAGDETLGIAKERLKSLPYYLSASEDGDVNAMVFAGSIYQYTSQEAARFEQALKWYGKALDDNAKVSEDKKLTENNVKYCYDNIKKMVDEGQVTKEAAAKWLQ